jgi:hypothetical protein
MFLRCGVLLMNAPSRLSRVDPTPTFSPPIDQSRPFSFEFRSAVWNR